MDLDQLISLTVAELPVAPQRVPDSDMGALVGQLVSRLESSPALETQLHSLNELSLLATTSPGPLLACLPSIYKILSSPATSPTILLAAFSFLCALFAPTAKDQAEDTKQRTSAKISFLQESMNGLSLAFAQSTQMHNATTSPALSVLVWLLTDSEPMSIVTEILQHRIHVPSFSTQTCLAEHLVQLLQIANPDAFTVIDLVLSIPGAIDGQSALVASCTKAGILEQALRNIEADKVTTPRAISSMHILTLTVDLAANLSPPDATFSLSQEVIQRNVIGSLGDLVHACTYSLISDLADKKPFGDAVATVLSKALHLISMLISPGTKQLILDSKIFAYSLMLVCSPADADFAHKDIRLVSLDAAKLILQLVGDDPASNQKIANTVVLSLQPGVSMRSIDVPTRLSHILLALWESIDPDFYAAVLRLLLGIFQQTDLVAGCLNAVTNPLFSLYKASWTGGFKLLARTLGMRVPEDISRKSSKEQAYMRFSAYAQEAQKIYRTAVVQTLGKGDSGPKCSVSKQTCINLLQCMANSELPPTVLVASATCLLSMIASNDRNGQCLAFSVLSCPKTIYDSIPTFLGALFGSAARALSNQQSALSVLTLLIALLDILKSDNFFAFVSLFYISDPAELVKHLSNFIAVSLKVDTPALIRGMAASIIASMPAAFYTSISPLLSETFSSGESLRTALKTALVQGKTASLPESSILLPHLAHLRSNTDALIDALNALPLAQKSSTSTLVLPAVPSFEQKPALIPHSPISLPKPSIALTNTSTQTDLNLTALMAEHALLKQEISQLREENTKLAQKISAYTRESPFNNQPGHASTSLAPTLESRMLEPVPTDVTERNKDELATSAAIDSEPLTSVTEESGHLEERLGSEIPNVDVPDCLQPLTDATATSNPEDFFDQIDIHASSATNVQLDQNMELPTSNISLANADPGPSTQLCSDLFVNLSQDVSDPVALPLPDDSAAAHEALSITEQPPVPMVPINIPVPTSGTVGSRRPGRGGIRARYATGLSEDARKNIAIEEQNNQSL